MARKMKPKQTWQERVRDTEKYHKDRVRVNKKHRIQDTANELRRSHGSICEDLMLASWINSHPKIADMKSIVEAIEWVRDKKLEYRRR